MKIVVYGGNGWIGEQFVSFFKKHDINHKISENRLIDDINFIQEELNDASHVLCLIGRTHGPGKPSIDYLESKDKLYENVNDNLYSPIVLAELCKNMKVHLTYLGTGCIFNGYDTESTKDESKPNFFGSSYSVVKGFTDRLMHDLYSNCVLNVRIRLPVDTKKHSRNLITKLVNYKRICSVPNSITVLPRMIPLIYELMKEESFGTYNMTNPGSITHDEILNLYKEIVDPSHTWENFTIEEQETALQNQRSNTELNTDKLESKFPDVLDANDAVRYCLKSYN